MGFHSDCRSVWEASPSSFFPRLLFVAGRFFRLVSGGQLRGNLATGCHVPYATKKSVFVFSIPFSFFFLVLLFIFFRLLCFVFFFLFFLLPSSCVFFFFPPSFRASFSSFLSFFFLPLLLSCFFLLASSFFLVASFVSPLESS